MARILVTGASGFIGSHVVSDLASRGHNVVATGRCQKRLNALKNSAAQVVSADLCLDELEPALEACTAVVHCAALSSPWGRPEQFWQANVIGTERLLRASQRAGVQRFIHMGSPSIYFRFADQYQVGEDFQPPRHWITEYARSKWESELRVRAAASTSMGTLVLRPRAVFGERDRAILPRLLTISERGWFPLIRGGEAIIDVTYIENFTQLVACCLNVDITVNGRAYNVTNGTPIRVRDLLAQLFSELGQDVRMVSVPRSVALALAKCFEQLARIRPGQPEPRLTRYGVGVIGYSQTLDISRAQHELGYLPSVSIHEGIARFAKWWRQHATS